MATPTLPIDPSMGSGHGFTHGPPDALKTTDLELYNYLQMIHSHIFGLEGSTGDITAFHDAGTHNQLSQASAISDASGAAIASSTVSVDSADATAGSEAGQVTLMNELKADVNSHITEFNTIPAIVTALQSKVNALLASLRTAKVIAT